MSMLMKGVAREVSTCYAMILPGMTRIITEGFLDYPLHIMPGPASTSRTVTRTYPPRSTMLASSYQWVRHAVVVATRNGAHA